MPCDSADMGRAISAISKGEDVIQDEKNCLFSLSVAKMINASCDFEFRARGHRKPHWKTMLPFLNALRVLPPPEVLGSPPPRSRRKCLVNKQIWMADYQYFRDGGARPILSGEGGCVEIVLAHQHPTASW